MLCEKNTFVIQPGMFLFSKIAKPYIGTQHLDPLFSRCDRFLLQIGLDDKEFMLCESLSLRDPQTIEA